MGIETDSQEVDGVDVTEKHAQIEADIENQRNVVGVIQMNAAVNHAQSVVDLGNEFSDVFTDETGIDLVDTTAIYNSTSDYYVGGTAVEESDQFNLGNYQTSPTSPYTVTASQEDGGKPAWEAMDNVISGTNQWSTSSATTGWWKIELPTTKKFYAYDFYGAGNAIYSPDDWTIEGSNNDSDWDVLHTVTGGAVGGAYIGKQTLTSTDDYLYYRVNITANGGGSVLAIIDIKFYEEVFTESSANFTLQSAKQDVITDPTKGFLVVRHEAVDAVTMNTDFTAKISIDDGVTFTSAVTLTFFSVYDADSDIYVSGEVDVSAQSGSEIVIKYETANGKEQRVHGHYFGVGV